MISWPRRTLTFAGFVLVEYIRSWLFLVELIAGVALVALFLSPKGALDAPMFFTVAGLYTLAQTAYTTWIILGQGRRPQGYVVLARPLGRSGYLVGHYLASIGMTIIVYLVLSLVVLLLNWVDNRLLGFLTTGEWLGGTLPLLMDAAIVSAFVTLITPLVLTPWPRLLALGLLALALSSEAKLLDSLEAGWIVARLHELFGLLLLPVGAGFGVALQGGYTPDSSWVFGYQSALALGLLALAVAAFSRRETILS